MSALLLVDIQYDFLPGGSLAVGDGNAILEPVYGIIQSGKFDVIVASKDFHPPNHISFASRHAKEPFTQLSLPNGATQEMWPDHCVQGTHGSAVEAGVLDKLRGTTHFFVEKGTNSEVDAYSAFSGTDLGDKLKALNITRVYVVGLATDFCVRQSVLGALDADFETFVLPEGIRGVFPENQEKVLNELEQKGAKIISVGDL